METRPTARLVRHRQRRVCCCCWLRVCTGQTDCSARGRQGVASPHSIHMVTVMIGELTAAPVWPGGVLNKTSFC